MYIILLLASQLIFDVGISGKAIDRASLPQESWGENVLDLVKDINKVTNKISVLSMDWGKVNGTIEVEKNKLIENNKVDFNGIWLDWKKTENSYHRTQDQCQQYAYDSDARSEIENQYKRIQTIIVKPLDMNRHYIEDTLESLKMQITILKELFPFKLRNCNNETSCTEERTWAFNELNRSRMALKYLQDISINTLKVLRNVSYNMYNLKYMTKKELFDLKNKYTCCSSKKITCMNISTEFDKFEPLNFETLVFELKTDLEITSSTTPIAQVQEEEEEEEEEKEEEKEEKEEGKNKNSDEIYDDSVYNPYYSE